MIFPRKTYCTAFLLAVTLPLCSATTDGRADFLPMTPAASRVVDTYVVQKTSREAMLAVLSLQGIVNRDTARIYTCSHLDRWALDFYKEQGYITHSQPCTDPYLLLKKYRSYIKGAVVYDPDKDFTVNLATNIAGVEERVILSPKMVREFRRATGLTDITDLRTLNLPDAVTAFRWYKAHIFPRQIHTVLSVAKGLSFMYDIYRDYLVAFRIPTFWLPGKNDTDYDPELEKEVITLLQETPANIPVLGFWPGLDDAGQEAGYTEYEGVKLAGLYGKFTLVNTWTGNYSYHSGVRPETKALKQHAHRDKKFRSYDPSKKYVALVMTESGDAPAYYMYTGFFQRQWNQAYRGKVPLSYGIAPCIRMLMPGIVEYLYRTQTPNDYFFCAISGAGYCYPLEGYGTLTPDPDQTLREYFSAITAENMKLLDMDVLGIYTHPLQKWSDADRALVEKYIVPMPGLRSVMSGMHRTDFTAAEANEMLAGGISAHHTMTHWSQQEFTWNDESMDRATVDFLANDIRACGKEGDFIQAMCYSWHYGARRLHLLQEQLRPEGYEFVTLDEFDYLWRMHGS